MDNIDFIYILYKRDNSTKVTTDPNEDETELTKLW